MKSTLRDSNLALRVASRYIQAEGEAGEDEAHGKGGVPPRWQEWLKAVHQGGKKKVPNPNPDTSKNHPEVAFTTALKDKAVFRKALKDYHLWLSKNSDKGEAKKPETPAAKAKEPEKKSEPKTPPKLSLKVSDEEIDEIIKKHKPFFDSIDKEAKDFNSSKDIEAYEKSFAKGSLHGFDPASAYEKKAFAKLSEPERYLHVSGHKIGQYFQNSVIGRESKTKLAYFMNSWTDNSGSMKALIACTALEQLGVTGYRKDEEKKKTEGEESIKKDIEEYKALVKELQVFQLAVFKKLGIKELTLFRGVQGQSVGDRDPPAEGDEITVKTRELSSFTSDPRVSGGFGRTIEMKVPVDRVFASSIIYPKIGSDKAPNSLGEAEVVVMGASDLTAVVAQPKIEKSGAKQ